MGMDRHEYIGPYFRCQSVTVSVSEEIRTCSKKQCNKYRNKVWDNQVKYCPSCGGVISLMPVPKDAPQAGDPWEVMEDTDDAISLFQGEGWDCPDDTHIFVPNGGYDEDDFGRSLHIDDQETGEWEFDTDDITRETQWLEDDFADQLEYLEKRYGAENVSICWGVLAAWS